MEREEKKVRGRHGNGREMRKEEKQVGLEGGGGRRTRCKKERTRRYRQIDRRCVEKKR